MLLKCEYNYLLSGSFVSKYLEVKLCGDFPSVDKKVP